METNSPNGSGKGTWRERLGIGGKELPKIAGEFSAKPGEPKIAPRPAPARAQTVTKPAPMAPRPAPGTRSPVASGRPAITPQTTSDSLAERLRAQRAAAEKLAEQRVAAARDRVPPAVNGSGRHGGETKTAERPKFSFADDHQAGPAAAPPTPPPAPISAAPPPPPKRELPPPPRVSASPIVPPRPALGGEPPRPDALRGKPAVPPYQSQFNQPTPPPGGYRPLDPPGFQYQPRPPTRPYSPPAYGGGNAGGEPRLAPAARSGYRRPPEEEEFYDDAPRRARGPNRGRPSVAEDDLDEVFEDDTPAPKARRRASAQDYGRAYREYEDEFGDTERRRSRGPFMILAGLVLLAALIGGGIWYYNNFYKSQPTATSQQGEVPVVAAPADPAKVDPPAAETPAAGEAAAPAARAKKFYDRILGDQAIEGGQMVPTEEAPVAPAPATTGSGEAVPDPATAASPADPNAAPADPATEALPLPLPPPAGGDTQGALPPPKNGQSADTVIPAAAPPAEEALAPVPGEAPVPQVPATPAAAPVPTDTAAAPPAETAEVPAEATPEEIKPVVKKAKVKTAETKTKKRVRKPEPDETSVAEGSRPVVLVPPAAETPAAETAPAPEATVAEAPQSGSFFSSTRKLQPTGKGAENAVTQQATLVKKNFKSGTIAPPAATDEPQQVASIADDPAAAEPVPEPTPEATGSTGRYVVQLGSFRSESEAQSEANRLKTRTSALNGVGTRVVRATVFGSSRYRVMTTPVADRATGDRICEALLSANEPNCSVKQQ